MSTTDIPSQSEVYPSISEILPEKLLGRMPFSLVSDIEERYEKLGGKYLTDELTEDGRRINACMNKNSVQDAIEEVIDAVFNVCVWMLKINKREEIDADAVSCLFGLIEIYALLHNVREYGGGN